MLFIIFVGHRTSIQKVEEPGKKPEAKSLTIEHSMFKFFFFLDRKSNEKNYHFIID